MLLGPGNEMPWVPRMDMLVNSNGDLIIKVELASLHRDHLELAAEGQRLRIEGRRLDADHDASDSEYLLTQIPKGRFDAFVDVPPGFDIGKARAAFQNGLLRIDIPKRDSWTQRTC